MKQFHPSWKGLVLFILIELLCTCTCFENPPYHVHLALTGDPTQMVVSWRTKSGTNTSTVTFGLTSHMYKYNTIGEQQTYNDTVGYFHNVVLSNLQTGAVYYYICGDEQGGFSQEYNFTTSPPYQRDAQFSLAMFGDMGVYHSNETIASIANITMNRQIDMVYHLGDMSYSGDYPSELFEDVWWDYFSMIESWSPYIPYMEAPGNNDRGCKKLGKCKGGLPATRNFTAYSYRFRMPSAESNSPGEQLYFSFDYQNVHFISISTETDYPKAPFGVNLTGGKQLEWLEQDLIFANANRDQVPWIIVCGHRPIYTSLIGMTDWFEPTHFAKIIQENFEDLFFKYQVDLYMNGHVHGYERSWPVYRSKEVRSYNQPQFPVHILSGSAGNIEGMNIAIEYMPVLPRWTAFRSIDPSSTDKYDFVNAGYGILNVLNSTHLNWQFIRVADNQVIDEITIVNTH
eukprot:TRINITY_DN2433_c0_g1_i2.p1 TRINITY_DN2433_c0_g1~~TRINITY_DN2433_c0_g1_i2.p1  ORF type:complete len:456 (-),score=46.13 TRINITY_DN2433_c0_g1_i2:52-1419(-)